MALLIASSALSFSGPAVVRPARASISMASIEDLPGAGPETGGKVWDPLSLADMCPYGSEQFEWMRTAETKHGRVCMAASVGYLISEAGITFPGYLSTSEKLAFADLPKGLAAWDAVPMAGKVQILLAAGLIELASELKKPHYLKGGMITFADSTPRRARGRMAELKNGRLAMIAVASFYFGSTLPGSVPALPPTWV